MTDALIREILTTTKTIALVGASDKPHRDSHRIMAFLLEKGFDVAPVNPRLEGQMILGRKVVGSLGALGHPVDMVDVFRASEEVPPLVDEAIRTGAKFIWMQLGVIHEGAAAKARAAGLRVVMDRCPLIEWRQLGL